jgi:hypothetical protein
VLQEGKDSIFSKQFSLGILAIMAGIYLLAGFMQANMLLNWDVSWLIHASSRLLAGGTYHADFFEINPPMILYHYIPTVLIAKIFSINFMLALRIYVFSLAGLSLCLCLTLIQKIFTPKDEALAGIFFIVLTCVFLLVPVYEFGQKEHLLILFTLPYLLLVSSRLQGVTVKTSLAITIGILAGLGFAIKPHFLIMLTLVELYYILRTKKLLACIRIETLVMAAIFIIYLASVFVFFKEYIFVIIPYITHFYYSGFSSPWTQLLFNQVTLFAYFVTIFYLLQMGKNPYQTLCSVLLAAMLGALVSFGLQHTLWYYHVIPVLSLAILLLTLLFFIFAQQCAVLRTEYIMVGSLGLLFALFSVINGMWTILVLQPIIFFSFSCGIFAPLLYFSQDSKNFYKLALSLSIIFGISIYCSYLQRDIGVPHRFTATVLFSLVLFGLLVSKQGTRKIHYAFTALIGMLVFSFPFYNVHQLYGNACVHKENLNLLIAFMHDNALHKPVYFFTSSAPYTFPLIDYAGSLPATRVAFLGWVPGMVRQENLPMTDKKLQEHLSDKAFLIKMLSEDITTKKPQLIFVDIKDHKDYMEDFKFDYLRYFSADKNFQTAWKNYRYLTTIENLPNYKFDVYQLKAVI